MFRLANETCLEVGGKKLHLQTQNKTSKIKYINVNFPSSVHLYFPPVYRYLTIAPIQKPTLRSYIPFLSSKVSPTIISVQTLFNQSI